MEVEAALMCGLRELLNDHDYETTACVGDTIVVYVRHRHKNQAAQVMILADGYITIWYEVGDGDERRCDLQLSDPRVFEKLLEVLNG